MTDINKTLELLLSSPHCRSSETIGSFFNEIGNFLKEKTDLHKIDFRKRFDNAAKTELWGPGRTNSTWKQQFITYYTDQYRTAGKRYPQTEAEIHFKLFIKGPATNKYWWETSAVKLLEVIRDRPHHTEDYTSEEKRRLGWYTEHTTDQFVFKNHLFVQNIVQIFPQLLPFTWHHFCMKFKGAVFMYQLTFWSEFKNKFKNFYPKDINYYSSLQLDLTSFVDKFDQILQCQIDEGFLEERFRLKHGNSKMELRILPDDLSLDFPGNMEISVSRDCLIVKYPNSTHDEMKYMKSPTASAFGIPGKYYFVTDSSHIIESDVLSKMRDGHKIVYFAKRIILENLIEKFSKDENFIQDSVIWTDLRVVTRNAIKGNAEFRIVLQTYELQIGNYRNEVVNRLEGKSLNALLRNKSLNILDKVPETFEPYINRHIYKRGMLKSEFLTNMVGIDGYGEFKDDVFFIINNTPAEITHIGPHKLNSIKSENVFQQKVRSTDITSKVLMIKDKIFDFGKAIKSFQGTESKKFKVHFLLYSQNNLYEWLPWQGTHVNFETEFGQYVAVEEIKKHDDVFIKIMSKYSKSERLVVFADFPGMGKTQFLKYIAKKLIKELVGVEFVQRIVIFSTVQEFVVSLEKNKNSSDLHISEVITALVTLLESQNNGMNKGILGYLLRQNEINREKILFEVLFDGLDEIDHSKRELVYEALEIIQKKMSSTRVWITLRDHMLIDIQTRFSCLGYKLMYLKPEEQKCFLKGYWQLKCKIESPSTIDDFNKCLDSDDFKMFIDKCINILDSEEENIEIVGIPLQLFMIAEIYKSKVEKLDFSTDDMTTFHSLVELYNEFFIGTVVRYIAEKRPGFLQSIPSSSELKVIRDDCIFKSVCEVAENSLFYLSIKLLISDDVANACKWHLLKEKNVDNKMMEDVGIVRDTDPLIFLHRTFAEYFVAKFGHKILKTMIQCNKNDIGNFKNHLPELSKFLYNHLLECVRRKTCDDDYEEIVEFKHKNVCHFLNLMCKTEAKILRKKENEIVTRDLFVDLTKEIKTQHEEDVLHGLELLFLIFYYKFDNIHATLLHSEDYIIDLLYQSTSVKMFAYIVEKLGFSVKHWPKLRAKNSSKQNIIHIFLESVSLQTFEEQEIKTFLNYLIGQEITILNEIKESEPTNLDTISSKLLKQKDSQGRIPFFILMQNMVFSPLFFEFNVHKYFVEDLQNKVLTTDSKGNSVLHYDFEEHDSYLTSLIHYDLREFKNHRYNFFSTVYPGLVKYLLDNGCSADKTINHFNENGETPLIQILKTYDSDNFKKDQLDPIMVELVKTFNDHGADFNVRDKNGESVLEKIFDKVVYKLNTEVIKELLLCQSDEIVFDLLVHVVKKKRSDLVKRLVEIRPSVLRLFGEDGMSILDYETSENIRYFLKGKIQELN